MPKKTTWMVELNESVTARIPGFQIKENCDPFTPVAVVPTPLGGRSHKKGFSRQQKHANLIQGAPELHAALKLHLKFLDSLPKGWLAHTTGDVGLLNDAYLASGLAIRIVEGET